MGNGLSLAVIAGMGKSQSTILFVLSISLCSSACLVGDAPEDHSTVDGPPSVGCEVNPSSVAIGETFEISGTRVGRKTGVDIQIDVAGSLTTEHVTTNGAGAFRFEKVAEVSGDGLVRVVDASSGDLITSCSFLVTGCDPATCGPDDCGTIDDGCGGSLDCGDCPICDPATCGPDDCGTLSDGCGGVLDCGDCGSLPVQPPADGTVDGAGRFRIGCDFSHQAQVDPIVIPYQPSGHMHDFFGNTLTTSDPDYERMLDGASSCDFSQDTAAYWFPALRAPDGTFVQPDHFQFYYRARPENYEFGTNYFPPDFKMIAGGVNAPDTAGYWTCKGESDTGYTDRKTYVPDCTGVEEELLVAHVFFPSCWDGVSLDSADHRSHVAYGLDDDGDVSSSFPDTCPASHPYKIPQLDLRVVYPITDGTGYVLADGNEIPHADFWNTWQQDALEKLIDDCLRTGINCEGISD